MVFDKELRGAAEDIVVSGGPLFEDLQQRLASLHIKVRWGLGSYQALKAPSYAFVTLRDQSSVLYDYILRDGGIYDMDSDFDSDLDGLQV